MLVLPAGVLLGLYGTGAVGYGRALSVSGLLSTGLLLLTLTLPHLPKRYLRHRRAVGVAVFGYAVLHLAIYAARKGVLTDALRPDLLTGWIALLVFAALAITSRNAAVRAMGARWKRLHALVWPAAALTAAHWWLSAFDITLAVIFALALAGLYGLRAYRRYR